MRISNFKTPLTKQKMKNPPPLLQRNKNRIRKRRFAKFALVSPDSLENDYTWMNIKPIPFKLNLDDSDSDSMPVFPSDIDINNDDLSLKEFNCPNFDPHGVDYTEINFEVPSLKNGRLSKIFRKIKL
jgi:hypothetical protein